MEAALHRRPLRRHPAAQGTVRAHRRRQEEARAVLLGMARPELRQPPLNEMRAARLRAVREQQEVAPVLVQVQSPPKAANSRQPGSSQPRNLRPAAGHRRARQHKKARGDLLCAPAQEWERKAAKTRLAGQAVQAPPPRKRQAAAFTNSRKRRSARQFLVYGLVRSRRLVEAASRERENPGNRLSYIRRRKQLPARFPPRSPAPKPTHSRRGRQSPFARTGRQRFPRRPELPLLGGVSAIRLVRQEHAEFPTPHSRPLAAARLRPVWQERARPPDLHSHPLVAACPRPVQQERGKLPDPHSRPLAAVCPRPVQQERARPPDLHSRPSAAAYPRPVQQERARPPDPHSHPLAAARLRPVWQERARPPDPHSHPLVAACPRPVQQGRAKPPDPHSRPLAAAYPRPVWQERARPPDLYSRPPAAACPRPVWQERTRPPDPHSRPLAAVRLRPVRQEQRCRMQRKTAGPSGSHKKQVRRK